MSLALEFYFIFSFDYAIINFTALAEGSGLWKFALYSARRTLSEAEPLAKWKMDVCSLHRKG